MNDYTYNNIESSRKEYDALHSSEWRKDYFNEENGGFIATHIYKERDDLRRPGIAAEVKACFELDSSQTKTTLAGILMPISTDRLGISKLQLLTMMTL